MLVYLAFLIFVFWPTNHKIFTTWPFEGFANLWAELPSASPVLENALCLLLGKEVEIQGICVTCSGSHSQWPAELSLREVLTFPRGLLASPPKDIVSSRYIYIGITNIGITKSHSGALRCSQIYHHDHHPVCRGTVCW